MMKQDVSLKRKSSRLICLEQIKTKLLGIYIRNKISITLNMDKLKVKVGLWAKKKELGNRVRR